MSTARDFLAAVQQRAKSSGTLSELGERLVELEETTDRLVAALTAALDESDTWQIGTWHAERLRAVITPALTPKENDS